MSDLLVIRTTKRVRLVRSRLKLIAAHLACRPTGADEMDLAKASAIEKGLVPGCGAPAPAHKFTRPSDFRGLRAILRNSLRFKARQLHFAQRNETFRTRGLKPFESLRTANQPFRGFLCYQGLEADFVSQRSRMVRSGPPPAEVARIYCARLSSSLQDWTGFVAAAGMEFLSRNRAYSTYSVN
jgi:hypothetical protein